MQYLHCSWRLQARLVARCPRDFAETAGANLSALTWLKNGLKSSLGRPVAVEFLVKVQPLKSRTLPVRQIVTCRWGQTASLPLLLSTGNYGPDSLLFKCNTSLETELIFCPFCQLLWYRRDLWQDWIGEDSSFWIDIYWFWYGYGGFSKKNMSARSCSRTSLQPWLEDKLADGFWWGNLQSIQRD